MKTLTLTPPQPQPPPPAGDPVVLKRQIKCDLLSLLHGEQGSHWDYTVVFILALLHFLHVIATILLTFIILYPVIPNLSSSHKLNACNNADRNKLLG